MEQKFVYVREVIINLQRFVRSYFKRKTIWLVMLMQELKQEIQDMIKETTDQNTMTDISANYFNNPRRLANDRSMR